MRMRGFSLRTKLMIAMTAVPVVGLSLFLLLAKAGFEKDKTATVFESSLLISKMRAARVGSELNAISGILQTLVLGYRADTKNLSEAGSAGFAAEPRLDVFQIYAWNPETSSYERHVDLGKGAAKHEPPGGEKASQDLLSRTKKISVAIGEPEGGDRMWMAARFGEANDPRHLVVIALVEVADLARVFTPQGPETSFLARKEDGRPVFAVASRDWTPEGVWTTLAEKNLPEGTEELKAGQGERFLASFAEVGVGDLVAVALTERSAVLSAFSTLVYRSILFYVVLAAMAAITAIFFSRSLTFALERLQQAAARIGGGDFNTRAEIRGKGEVAQLVATFNTMASNVARLNETFADKAQRDARTEVGKTLKEALAPAAFQRHQSFVVAGDSRPSSDCGGDWWHHYENGGKLYLWIGDAGARGTQAALVAGAARGLVGLAMAGPPRSVSDCMMIVNRGVFDAFGGQAGTSVFVACIDLATGDLSYANASHPAPFLLKNPGLTGGAPGADAFHPLNATLNPLLGTARDRIFATTKLQLQPGDNLVLYSDGLLAVQDGKKHLWGERRFLEAAAGEIVSGAAAADGVSQAVHGIVGEINAFRRESALEDDVTIVICRYQPQAETQAETQSETGT